MEIESLIDSVEDVWLSTLFLLTYVKRNIVMRPCRIYVLYVNNNRLLVVLVLKVWCIPEQGRG